MKGSKVVKKKEEAKQENFKDVVSSPHTEGYVTKIKSDLQYLKKLLFQWSIYTNNFKSISSDHHEKQILKNYLKYHHEYYEYDQFDSNFQILDTLNVNLDRIASEELIYKSFDMFSKRIWPVRFSNKFVARMQDFSLNEMIYILGYVCFLADGNFMGKPALKTEKYGYARPIDTKMINFNRFFSVKIFKEKNLFVHIGVEKKPITGKSNIIKRYQFTNYLQVLDILGDQMVENKNKLEERMLLFRNTILEDVSKKDHSDQIQIDAKNIQNLRDYFFYSSINPYTEVNQIFVKPFENNVQYKFYPIPFKIFYVSSIEATTMIFDQKIKRWIAKDYLDLMEKKKLNQYQKKINEEMIKRFVDFQSAKNLVELLTKIPNFKVNLTDQQKDVIGENGNILAIGRSGTGKTTCAVLRLFSIEMLFKIRLSLYKKKFQDTIKDTRCSSSDIDSAFGLHCIFLTASPVLTHEIQRYYKKLTENIKEELEKKKKRIEEEKQKKLLEEMNEKSEYLEEDQPEMKSVEISREEEIIEKDAQVPEILLKSESQKSVELIEEENQINEEFKDLNLKQDINNQQFDQDEEDADQAKHKFEENIKKFHSLYDLEENDYPGFFTVKSYIMMIDGVLARPFFIRKKNEVINQDSKAAWHNEKKGVMMIENYFRHENENDAVDNINQIEEEINYSDEEELEHEYMRQIQLRENRGKQQLTKKLESKKQKQQLAFEVDYDYFVIHFWPNVHKKYYSSRNITAHLVWTEIYSTIKGSAHAHLYPGQYLSQQVYMSSSSNSFLTKEEKLDIYQCFCQYERWKIRAGGYDIIDTVNYILNFIRFRGYEGPQIHYIMIDQVQDLPHAMIYLLSKTASYGVFYSGDTAQTIAKGVGFRFCDLKTLFNPQLFDSSLTLKAPIIKHLTVNFRSHNNILQLANSIVSSLQILFPKTIDRLNKEVSDLQGPKPMILAENDEDLLFYVLCGEEAVKEDKAMKKPPLEFGCDQVIIVRDQESKAKIPVMLQHALCLTIYEAKGLEFNDVILFNFFAESKCPEKWNLLKSLNVTTNIVSKEDYQRNMTKHKQREAELEKQKINLEQKAQKIQKPKVLEEVQEEVDVMMNYNKENQTYLVKKIVGNLSKFYKDINDYAQLCSELKLLYTSITRPRKTLIIYDEDSKCRENIERLWQKLDVIQLISKELISDSSKSNSKANQKEEIKIFKKIVNSTDKNQWKKQGLKMYTRGYFEQAMKCFERSEDFQLYKKAEANKYADQATKKLIEIQSERSAIKQGFHLYRTITSSDLAKLKKQLKSDEGKAFKQFEIAGSNFEKLLMFKQAGQCYFSGKLYELAFENFCKAFMHKQAAESLQMQNKFREAADYYQKEDDYLKVIQCLDLVNEWSLILQKIQKYSFKMSEFEKQTLLKKYASMALEELVYEIEFQNQGGEQQKIKEDNQVEVIEEKQSDEEEEWDSDQDPELEAEKEYQRKKSSELLLLQEKDHPKQQPNQADSSVFEKLESNQPTEKVAEVSVYQQIEGSVAEVVKQPLLQEQLNSFSDLVEEKQTQKDNQLLVDHSDGSFEDLNKSDSFEDLNDKSQVGMIEEKVQKKEEMKVEDDIKSVESSFSDLNAKYEGDLEPDIESIKSLVDADDLWVRHSISEIGKKMQSEYSVIDEDQSYNINVKIIKTKGNIFIQDEIMTKIVGIVSIINTTVNEFFKQFKGYQSLISVAKNGDSQSEENQEVRMMPQISEFEDIDPAFINIILDTLESFKLFKLCLFVCNRYHLPNKAGRYLTSIGVKYSTNCQSHNIVNPVLLAPSSFRKNQLQKGILASFAMHAILENVNLEFLKVKVQDTVEKSKNSLGLYFIQGLILQGIYKKAIFTLNAHEALKILYNYNDYEGFTTIFKQKYLKTLESSDQNVQFLPNAPKHELQIQYTKIILKKAIHDYCVAHKFQMISNRYYKQFSSNSGLVGHGDHISSVNHQNKLKIAQYLPFSKALIQNREDIGSFMKKNILKGYEILTKGNELQVFDLTSTLIYILYSQQLQDVMITSLNMNSFLEFYRCINYVKLILSKIRGRNWLHLLEPIFNLHQCYLIKPCLSMNFMSHSYAFVHRTSIIANQLVDKNNVSHGFAFFFQQDYNLICVKTAKLIQIVYKKFQTHLSSFYKRRLEFTIYKKCVLPEDLLKQQQQEVVKKALKCELHINKKQQKNSSGVSVKKKKEKRPIAFDFKLHGKESYVMQLESSSEEDEGLDKQIQSRHFLASFNPRMQYLFRPLLESFSESYRGNKDLVIGKDLYCCDMNNSYREYVQRKGGFNLFDAIEFKKFKRVDLYAENILSIYDQLPLVDRHTYLAEILILLLIQYKERTEGKMFKLDLTKSNLKYLTGLKFNNFVNSNSNHQIEASFLRQVILKNQQQCIFTLENLYVCDMSPKELIPIITEYLQILRQEEASTFANFSSIIHAYVINMQPNKDIFQIFRKIINSFATQWENAYLIYLKDTKNYDEFLEKRQILITKNPFSNSAVPKLHEVRVNCVGNIEKVIEESEFDYLIQGKIIEGKKKAANKIGTWWKRYRIDLKERNRLNVNNYFEYFIKRNTKIEQIGGGLSKLSEIRVLKAIKHPIDILLEVQFLLLTEKARDDLLSFYLSNVIHTSLDFHFILMTLNKIEDQRKLYFKSCNEWQAGIIQVDAFEKLKEEANQINKTIQIWKNDAKWLREKDITFKKKKVFEVKWMTKNIGIGKMIKKRAGLKKQVKLQEKKKMIKRIE